jgi:VIT1/CCC1 family predicted Fe2+/Mn2+ transporter
MYLMACFSNYGRRILTLRRIRKVDSREARDIIADAMPPLLASLTTQQELDALRQKLIQLPEPPERPRLTRDNWLASLGMFPLVVSATFPVVVPFVFVSKATRALRISNGIAIVMLFLTGYAFGRYAGHYPWRMGLRMVLARSAMAGVTIALGG